MGNNDREKLKKFIKNRNELIYLLENNNLTKDMFIEKNQELIRMLGLKPYLNIDSIEQGIYNYQYYNLLAKKEYSLSKKTDNNRRINEHKNKSINYYSEKDKATFALIKLSEKDNIESYYIKLNSNKLNESIFEIVLLNLKYVILHSKDKNILLYLKNNNLFSNMQKISLIDTYVNISY